TGSTRRPSASGSTDSPAATARPSAWCACRAGRRGVSKKGNPRVRAMLVEMVWRMMRWQPDYHGLRKWMPVLADPGRGAAARKKAVAAIARQLAVDLWRLFTGRTTADKLGLIHLPDPV